MRRRILRALALATVASGCLPLVKGQRDTPGIIASKTPPLTLVATSGLKCAVDPVTYALVKPGEQLRCSWQVSDSTRPTASPDIRVPHPASYDDKRSGSPLNTNVDARPWWWPFGRKKR